MMFNAFIHLYCFVICLYKEWFEIKIDIRGTVFLILEVIGGLLCLLLVLPSLYYYTTYREHEYQREELAIMSPLLT